LPVATPSDEQIAKLASAILARDRYRTFRPESYDLLKWLRNALGAFFDFIADLYVNNPALYWLLVAVLGAICALLLTHMVWTLSTAMRASTAVAPLQQASAELDFVAEAQRLAARGEHLEAAHRLLLASLRALARARHIPLHPEDGNGTVCRQLAASKLPGTLRDQLIQLIVQTEHAWFGDVAAGDDAAAGLYRRWRAAHAALIRTEVT